MSGPPFNGNSNHDAGEGQQYAELAEFASQWAARTPAPPFGPPPRLHPPQPHIGYAPYHAPPHGYPFNAPPGFFGSPHMRANAPRIKAPLIPRPAYSNPSMPTGGFFSAYPPPAPRMVPPPPPRGPPPPMNSWEWNSRPPLNPPPSSLPMPVQPPPPPMYPEKEETEEWSVNYDPTLEAEGEEYVKSCVTEADSTGSPDSVECDTEDVGAMSHWLTGTAEAAYQQLPPHDHVVHAEWLQQNLSAGGEIPLPEVVEKPQKKIPIWMQEILEKKERERKKKQEEEERERLLEEKRKQRDSEKAILRQGMHSDSEEEPGDRSPLRIQRQSEKENQEIVDKTVRSITTKLLISITDEMIEQISKETLEKMKQIEAKKKAEPEILTSCPALAAISAFGDDSDDDNDESQDSEDQVLFRAPLPPVATYKKQLSDRSEEPKQASPDSSSSKHNRERSHERRSSRDDDDSHRERKRRRRSRSSERRHKRASRSRSRSPDRTRKQRDSHGHHRR